MLRRSHPRVVRAAALAAEGKHYDEISAALEVSEQTIRNWARRFGFVIARKNPPRAGGDRDQKIVSMFRQGITQQQIGDHFSITRERVRQILKRNGLVAEHGGQKAQVHAKAQAKAQARDLRDLARWGITYAEKKARRADGTLDAFTTQRNNAKSRGIEWSLTFPQWFSVWEASGKLSERGRGMGKYVMSRIKDEGGYVFGNVHIQLSTENNRQGLAICRKRRAKNTGVWCIYPGRAKPWIAKVARTLIGTFATEEEAVAARRQFLIENPASAYKAGGRFRGFAIIRSRNGGPDRYQVQVGKRYVGTYRTPEEALAARAAYIQSLHAAQSGAVGADPSFNSLACHEAKSHFFA